MCKLGKAVVMLDVGVSACQDFLEVERKWHACELCGFCTLILAVAVEG